MDKIREQIWKVIQEMNRKWAVENNADWIFRSYCASNPKLVLPLKADEFQDQFCHFANGFFAHLLKSQYFVTSSGIIRNFAHIL